MRARIKISDRETRKNNVDNKLKHRNHDANKNFVHTITISNYLFKETTILQ